jgi:thioredoxin 1
MSKIIKIYADWCGPCKVLEKMLVKSNVEHESANIDSPDGEGLSLKYNVRAIPTMLVLDEDGNLLRKMTGLPATPEDLMKFVYEAD